MEHTSRHRVNDEIVEVPRQFKQVHLDAGYHEHEFGEHSSPDHELLGDHDGVLVEHLDEDLPGGCGGPVFRVTFSGGASVTVLCADAVRSYLGIN